MHELPEEFSQASAIFSLRIILDNREKFVWSGIAKLYVGIVFPEGWTSPDRYF